VCKILIHSLSNREATTLNQSKAKQPSESKKKFPSTFFIGKTLDMKEWKPCSAMAAYSGSKLEDELARA
jgi:hypothetical protein